MDAQEKKNIPIRRFPEFINDGEWIHTTLGAEMNYENGVAHENDINASGEYIVVNSKYISTEGMVEKRTNNPHCLADKCEILMVLSDLPNGKALAKCFYVDKSNKYTVNQRICRLKSKGTNSKLLFYLVNRNPYFLSFDDGVKQTNLKKGDVLNCPLIIPKSIKEQEFVAVCLSELDEMLSATNKKLEQLNAYKKGLMQKLFPAKGKKNPELRFKEFEKDGEWEKKTLEEIAISESSSLSLGKIDISDTGYALYGADGFVGLISYYNQSDDYIAIIKDGSGYGKVFVYPAKSSILSTMIYIKPINRKQCDLRWLYYVLQGIKFDLFVKGSGIPHIYFSDYGKHIIYMPSISEQRRISSCLLLIDEMINQYSNKVALLELYKKGLMQQMFPTLK